MLLEKIDLEKTGKFSTFFLDYVSENENLKPFYNLSPHPENFITQIKQKNFNSEKRKILVDVLQEQYKGIAIEESVISNLKSLKKNNTYTITTGHQLNIFTGPLYFIYKIVTVINACKILSRSYPDYNFVPFYWMASEDHDYEEISYINIKGKRYTWKTDQSGAVGRFDPKSLAELADEIPGGQKLFKEAYSSSATLSLAVRKYVNALFGEEGLVVIDSDHPRLKADFKDIAKDDLLNNLANKLVNETSADISSIGHKPQIYPREINFFYLDNDIRSRIIHENNSYQGLDTKLKFSEEELLNLLDQSPEKFSPNVILRPLYQEIILPNLAYIGGPAEIVYWLQLKNIFKHYQVPFPILIPRNFAIIISRTIKNKINKLGLSNQDLFLDVEKLKGRFAKSLSKNDLSLDLEKKSVDSIFSEIKAKASKIDKTLQQHIDSERKKALDNYHKIEKKFLKAEKRKHQDQLNQIDSIFETLSPKGGLQERTENFLAFYYDTPDFVGQLLDNLDPFDPRFHILSEND